MTEHANDTAFDAGATEARMDAIRLKEILGAPLTEQERMCLQIERNGFGCSVRTQPSEADLG
ncbi:MAG: hypothetical protein ACRDNJ_03830 [Solirubrobacteraceae bacterium]